MIESILITASFPAALLVSLTGLILVLNYNWRVSVVTLALQYIGVFFLAALSWPLEMAVAKLVAGWMASAVLGIAISEAGQPDAEMLVEPESAWPSSRLFRLLVASLVFLIVLSLYSQVALWVPGVSEGQALGALMLIGLGLLQLGLTARPIRVAAGLLTFLAGFEIIYAVVETSALLAGLLAAATLGVSLVGAYLIAAPNLEESG
jgi:hypothetical protein